MQLSLNLDPSPPHPASGTPNPAPSTPPPVFVFVRHPRARRYIIRVAEDGTVRVTVPRWGSKRAAAAFAERERAWIDRQLRRTEAAHETPAAGGRERQRANDGPEAASAEPFAEDQPALMIRARNELPRRLMELAERYGLAVTRISIRNQRWRWGSCSLAGHICLNWRLITMPAAVRDYVLIHELMHLKRMDHSPAFWKLVAAACPPYKEARAWLRSHGARSG